MDKLVKKNEQSNKVRISKIVFEENVYFEFFYKKTEKIASAVYLVTNLIKDEDAIKWQLRKHSLDLVSDIITLYHLHLSDKKHGKKVQGLIAELLSLFEIGSLAHVISEMNAAILSKELFLLLEMIESQIGDGGGENTGKQSLILSRDFFTLSMESAKTEELSKRHSKGHDEYNKMSFIQKKKSVPKISSFSHSGYEKNELNESSQSTQQGSGNRKSLILSVLKKSKDENSQKDIGISDLTSLIKGYSEKTIQRDLTAMVKEGVLKKSGERRWSRYSLL